MRVVPPYSDYNFFRKQSKPRTVSQVAIDLGILSYSSRYVVNDVLRELMYDGECSVHGFETSSDTQLVWASIKTNGGSRLFIVFRGTEFYNIHDWMTDANCAKHGCQLALGYGTQLHEGFLKAFRAIEPEIKSLCKATISEAIVFSGHSLGGALATIADALYPSSACVTFGAPAVFCLQQVEKNQAYLNRQFRYVHGSDVVPKLPPPSFGFKHLAGAMHLDAMPRPWANIFTPRPCFDHVPTLYAERIYGEGL